MKEALAQPEQSCPECVFGVCHCKPLAQPEQEAVAYIDMNKLELKAEEAECVTMCLNDRGVPTHEGDKNLSLWGRVEQYAKSRFLDGMTTNAPSVSDEHIKECAKVAGLIGNWSTAEVNDRIVGFARVLLGNPAVQEAFLKANTHLLYTTPPQRKPLTDEQMWELWNSQGDDAMEQQAAIAFARAIESAHGIGEKK